MGMIVEEKIEGTLCRLHPDPNDPRYTAQWIKTKDGEIKGLMVTEATLSSLKAFGAWVARQPGPLRLSTSILSIERIMKRFGFKELVKDK